ncbi:phosphopantothenate/pantothenate synthetase [Candidatus Bathyarchaeota archaeon]|nr:MAG: phosphopantothenate/pantothenate synthetase [Candidatus Bathyarchaeota archaeon]TMI30486.1 MAG: phosphopantothenate/pantothenate synthetase [Candidatus Bathyarchaeota archaeon]
MKISQSHPRFESLRTRELLVQAVINGIVAPQGLLAHGRGEAFDYLIGEKTLPSARKAAKVAAASLLLADHPVISVNGNAAALVPNELAHLASTIPADIEVNLFHRSLEREKKIASVLKRLGIKNVLGVGAEASTRILGISSPRRNVDPDGQGRSDVVLVPLEDGDRTLALRKNGQTVIAIDLNPLSRTAQQASITIVDNITRALPILVTESRRLKRQDRESLRRLVRDFDNRKNLESTIREIIAYLGKWNR